MVDNWGVAIFCHPYNANKEATEIIAVITAFNYMTEGIKRLKQDRVLRNKRWRPCLCLLLKGIKRG